MSTGAQSAVQFPAGFTDSGWIDTLLVSLNVARADSLRENGENR